MKKKILVIIGARGIGDLIYLSEKNGNQYLDQVPDAEVAFISTDPSNLVPLLIILLKSLV